MPTSPITPLDRRLPSFLTYGHAISVRLIDSSRTSTEIMIVRGAISSAENRAKARTGFVRVLEIIPLTKAQFEHLHVKLPPVKHGRKQLPNPTSTSHGVS